MSDFERIISIFNSIAQSLRLCINFLSTLTDCKNILASILKDIIAQLVVQSILGSST
jgi:hypothetical protein